MMTDDLIKFTPEDLRKIRIDALTVYREAEIRGLVYSGKWLSELAISIEAHFDECNEDPGYEELTCVTPNSISGKEHAKHAVALSYYNLKEYKRAEHLTRDCVSKPVQFLHYYCKYMAGESIDSQTEQSFEGEKNSEGKKEHLVELCSDLTDKHKEEQFDAYLLYIYGVVLKKGGHPEEAQSALLKAVTLEPCLWSAWHELATMLVDRNDLCKLQLPDHWMKHFFLAHTYLDLQLGDHSANIYSQLLENGFSHSTYVIGQLAVAYDNTKNVDMAKECFVDLRKKDPYRLDNMDTYSNVLYVKDLREELAYLAAKCVEIDKYRAETCCVIGNYYSIREQHEHAARYFHRALKLNPKFISAWTLMGHEYMEMNNQSAAIQAYRQALEVDSRDFRAWYGLGQTHEIMKMHHYSLYYYQQALKLRPNDSRMLMAVGCAYKLLNKPQQAKICFWKAYTLGDPEGMALTQLAMLHEALKEDDNAAAAYTTFVIDATKSRISNPKEMAHAYKFLANYNIRIKNYDEAYIAAQKCIDYIETREEGKALLQQITTTSGVPTASTAGLAEGVQGRHVIDDSITQEPVDRTSTTPAPHLSPRNLHFMTPDH